MSATGLLPLVAHPAIKLAMANRRMRLGFISVPRRLARRATLSGRHTPGLATAGHPRNGLSSLTNGHVIPFDPDQRRASNEISNQPVARTDWTFALSIAATLGLAVGAISILLFAM
ncbi:hypothetical protein CQ14_38655 [Bradyrhizobium lablabi]|uniref:Uncharacterized protein n=2 Tax=Bradyrhizobium lablabi TaxID=722472 RepID=A0A0R3MF13_9BRAD|nr:hypothetical protein CQ14_38655 [Bradyrhizobium lablabi]